MMARTCCVLAAFVALAAGRVDAGNRSASGAFDRGGVEHRPDGDDIRRIQQEFTRNKLINELSADLVLDDQLNPLGKVFNAHSYHSDRIEDDPVEIRPVPITKTGIRARLVFVTQPDSLFEFQWAPTTRWCATWNRGPFTARSR